jgi:hypothetical protein
MEPARLSLVELGIALAAIVVALAFALVLWRILKRAIGGCISMGIGCLVLVAGLVVAGFFLLSRLGITSLDDMLRLVGL